MMGICGGDLCIATAPTTDGRRSLKTQQHAGVDCGPYARISQVVRETQRAKALQPGSADMLGPPPLGHRQSHIPMLGTGGPGGRRKRGTEVLPRKEVIQPQLPLRLPCYDFTPVTSPTFDGSLPCGLGHRLRVLLTPVV